METASEDTSISTTMSSNMYCRTERRIVFSYIFYRYDTCARCYDYLPDWIFWNTSLKYVYKGDGYLYDPEDNSPYLPDPNNTSYPIASTFTSEKFLKKWTECCQAALDCCDKMRKIRKTLNGTYCPRTWDGWQCWPDTPAGEIAMAPCANHVYFKSEPPACHRYATKECWPNGTWYVNKEFKNEWTNYGNCGRVDEVRRLLFFHIATFSISVVFLIPALIIFIIYKQLQVHRITMHKNLFISLFINGIVIILFKYIVMLNEIDNTREEDTILENNGTGCKILFILTKYFRMTNYMWMLCEGFYLHKLIAEAFAEQKSLIMFYLIGWGFPLLPVCIYASLRMLYADKSKLLLLRRIIKIPVELTELLNRRKCVLNKTNTTEHLNSFFEILRCWAIPDESYEWIMNIPNLISLLLNLAFLCNIIRVLVTKLRATNANEPSQYRKAVRATLILVPLFGLHFFLVIYHPQSNNCEILEGYSYFSHAMDGLQGMIVAIIFCYVNNEVLYLLKRSYQRYKLQRDSQNRSCNNFSMKRMSMTTHISTSGEIQSQKSRLESIKTTSC